MAMTGKSGPRWDIVATHGGRLVPVAWMQLMRRGVETPPNVIATRAVQEVRKRLDQRTLRWRTGAVTADSLVRRLQVDSIGTLWHRLAQRPFPAALHVDAASLEEACPGAECRLFALAERAARHQVDLLGTGEIALGEPIDWHRDFKVGRSWPLDFFSSIDCCDLDSPSDVKVPWEISRLQWLIPAGQAYLLTHEESFAATAKNILAQWIERNPCLCGVNWACTMEAAMRIFVWTWLFHVFQASRAWFDAEFRGAFLTTLYSHADFTDRYLEITDINGNHCTADAAALVFAGLFFGEGEQPRRWRRRGWKLLTKEITRQVTPDGVDFEGSIPYHRLVSELFLWPALYRKCTGRSVPREYRNRLSGMARFTAAYTRPDGGAPNWGDGDDARVLPFSADSLHDHRYLPAAVGLMWGEKDLLTVKPGPLDEVYWMFGKDAARQVQSVRRSRTAVPRSIAFRDSGYYVLQNDRDHVFIDCAPVGLAGRGGHGHNDCLSLEVTLDGVHLMVDPGSYVYTASYLERNRFRSTARHNTPMVDEEEINRFPGPRGIWSLGNDAQPTLHHWRLGVDEETFRGSHGGYHRLAPPVDVAREIRLRHSQHRLEIIDEFTGLNGRLVEIPLHLAPAVQVEQVADAELQLTADGKSFRLSWEADDDWTFRQHTISISPSYGRLESALRLSWTGTGNFFRLLLVPTSGLSSAAPLRETSHER